MKNDDLMTVSKIVKLLDKKENRYGARGSERILGLCVNAKDFGYITSAKLEGWGGGLVADVFLDVETTSNPK